MQILTNVAAYTSSELALGHWFRSFGLGDQGSIHLVSNDKLTASIGSCNYLRLSNGPTLEHLLHHIVVPARAELVLQRALRCGVHDALCAVPVGKQGQQRISIAAVAAALKLQQPLCWTD